jgi:hypothetical protein
MSGVKKDAVESFAYPLDPSLFKLSVIERDFLHEVISRDDDELRRRVFEVQKESASYFTSTVYANIIFRA